MKSLLLVSGSIAFSSVEFSAADEKVEEESEVGPVLTDEPISIFP